MAEIGKDDLLLIHGEQLDQKLKDIEPNKHSMISWSDQELMRQIIFEWKTFKRIEIKEREKANADRLQKISEKLVEGNKAKNSKKG